MADQDTWTVVKRRMQARWGIVPPCAEADPSWTELADHVRDRAVRVGGRFVDVIREVATETTATISEASAVLKNDASQAGERVRSAGGTAKTGFDAARSAMEELIDVVRDGFVDGVSKAQADRDLPKALAESVGIAAGAVLSAVTGKSGDSKNSN